jgi:hypothetical protein
MVAATKGVTNFGQRVIGQFFRNRHGKLSWPRNGSAATLR